jgi:hypothetical protein
MMMKRRLKNALYGICVGLVLLACVTITLSTSFFVLDHLTGFYRWLGFDRLDSALFAIFSFAGTLAIGIGFAVGYNYPTACDK